MSGETTGAVATVSDLTRRFGDVAALDGIDLSVREGEWLGVTGPSGSGKTTLLNLLSGLDTPTAGVVRIDGHDLGQMSRRELATFRRRHVGLVFQDFHLLPYLTAIENVMVAQHIHSMADRDEAAAALEGVGLGDRLTHRPAQLSGGEKQRLCVARALINHPRLLLADEPTGNLDEENERTVLALLERLGEEGFTIVVVSHNPEVALHADRVVQLQHGRVVADQPQATREDRLLARIWEAERETSARPSAGSIRRRDVERARGRSLVDGPIDAPNLTDRGRARARDLVRRLRLAETLLARTFEGSEQPPCGRLHPVTSAAAAEICDLLSHPERCPHGRPIPAAPCCRPLREALS